MSRSDVVLKLSVVDHFTPQVLEISAKQLAFADGKRWASLTGWQRDKYRRMAKRRVMETAELPCRCAPSEQRWMDGVCLMCGAQVP